MNLITRLLDAEPGQVLIDGRPIREIPLGVVARLDRLCAAGDLSVQ